MSAGGDIIEFGRFRLHRRNGTLQADGQNLDLGVRAIDVLLALIDAGGKVVTKDELLDRVWSGFVVEENNLHVQINQDGAPPRVLFHRPGCGGRQISFGDTCRC
jgi:DNA-binding winged helix-turn-helix (wHTH) protein